MTTIQEIEAGYGGKAAGTVQVWYETQDELEPVEGPHGDLFTAKQRARAAGTQMGERVRANVEGYCKEHRDSSPILLSNHLVTPGGCIPIG